MPSLILIVLLLWFVLAVLLAAWTLWFQGYIYSEPVEAIYWRAPAAGAALTAFLVLWLFCDYRSVNDPKAEGRYQPLHNVTSRETERYEHLWIYRDGRKEHYEWNGKQYQRKGGRPLPTRPDRIIVSHQAEGDEHVFEPERDAKGNFKVGKDQGSLRYHEKDNPSRYMEESAIGQISIFHFGWLIGNLLLNFGFLVVWFLVMWLLLRFQWPHALGLAVVFWLVMLLFVLPPILTQTEKVRKERLPPTTVSDASQKRAPSHTMSMPKCA